MLAKQERSNIVHGHDMHALHSILGSRQSCAGMPTGAMFIKALLSTGELPFWQRQGCLT